MKKMTKNEMIKANGGRISIPIYSLEYSSGKWRIVDTNIRIVF